MIDVSYFDAWGQWWHGGLGPKDVMWGVPIFAWERIGKLMGFIGGMTVVLDIVGAPAVRSFGKRLRDWITVREAVTTMFYSVMYAIDNIGGVNTVVYESGNFATRLYLAGNSPEREKSFERLRTWIEWDARKSRLREIDRHSETMTDFFVLIISVVVIFGSLVMAPRYWSGAQAIMFLVLFLVSYTLFAVFILDWLLSVFWPSIAGLILVISSCVALFVDAIIDRIADVLEHPRNDKVIRTIGVLLFLVGFHFDMLGS